jgi:parallel beta-helix repeat protein
MERYRRLLMAVPIGCLISLAAIWMIAGTRAVHSDLIVMSTEVPTDDRYLWLPLVAKNYTVQYRWGDWIVTGAEAVEKATIFMNGNVIVENGGSLTLTEVVLTMDCSYEGEYGILANPGSSLSIYNSTIRPLDQESTLAFVVDDAQLVLRNNEIQGVGWLPDLKALHQEDELPPRDGIWISADGAIVEGNTIYHKESSGIRLQGGGGALITANKIVFEGWGESRGGIDIDHSHGNTITRNHLRKQIHPICLDGSWNNLVAENEITLKSHSTGIVVQEGSGNNVIASNTIAMDPTAESA